MAMATAMASSKLLPAAVNASVVALGWFRPTARPKAIDPTHISAKYTSSGSAIRATSIGFEVMASPCRANSTTMVNSSPYRANGPIRGISSLSYQVRPLAFSPSRRVRNPAAGGMPRKISTERAISHTDTSKAVCSRLSRPGRTDR